MSTRTAWIFVAAVGAFEIASTFLFIAATKYSLATLNDPARLVAIGDSGADLLRAAALLDMFGYLSALPLAAFLRERFHGESGIDFLTVTGMTFLVLSALGAAILAFAGAPLIHDYAHGQNTVALFTVIDRIVFTAMWQTVDSLLSAVWFIGVGRLAWIRKEMPLSLLLLAVGVIGIAFAVGHITALFPGSV